MANFISEDDIERALLAKLKNSFGYEMLNCHTSDRDDLNDKSGRTNKREVILVDLLRDSLIRLNPDLPAATIENVIERMTEKRRGLSPVLGNREVDDLIRNGVQVQYDDADGQKQSVIAKVIDFEQVGRNRFLAV